MYRNHDLPESADRRRALSAAFGSACLLAGAALRSTPASADTAELAGQPVQGGLVRGRTMPGARVWLDGQPRRVSDDGLFLLGFGRDAAETAHLRVTLPDGREEERVLSVARRSYDIQRIDGLPASVVTPPAETQARIRREAGQIAAVRQRDEPRTDFDTAFIWPVTGRITGVYGSQRILNGEPRQPHFGVDIAAPTGTPIVAPADAIVTLTLDMYFSGNTMTLDHGHGLSTTYLHMSRFNASEGQRVHQGEIIGLVGATGRATGPHLCWRMNLLAERLDPSVLVGPMPG
jgi:murein DD-endopeptidase MepM/ murein hydrolase activator NlpD